MKANERRLLMVFLSLAFLLGAALLVQVLRKWQHRIERAEHEAVLAKYESTTLLEQAPQWLAKEAWLTQAQPVVTSEAEANTGLFDSLNATALSAGLKTTTVQVEGGKVEDHYREFGVSMTVKGDFTTLMRWIHERLSGPFYVMPLLHITPDPEKPEDVVAKMRIVRWYAPQLASVTEAAPAEAPTEPPTEPQPPNP